ncbi:MAG: helix-turn-helix domain-containing protein [Clostridia bacterium]
MSRFQISQEEYEAIKECEAKSKDKKTSKNLRILMLRYEGEKVETIAKFHKVSKNAISQICMRYRRQGLDEFIRNKYTSHYRLLSEEQEKEILARFEMLAESGQQITAKAMKEALDEACGKDTGNVYVYNVLKRHKWRKVMPRSQHPKAADEEACNASKKLSKVWVKPL